MNAERDLNELATCVLDASLKWTGDAEAENPGLKRARTLAGLAIRRSSDDTGVRWNSAALPSLRDDNILLRSDDVLCQDASGNTLIGYVQYGTEGWDTPPRWVEAGRDMYELPDVVRWIYVSDVVEHISRS